MSHNNMCKTQFIACYTLFKNEIVRLIRIWPQSVVPPLITTILYYMIFGNFLGSRIGEIKGFSYIQFISPGLIMMSLINNSFTIVSSVYSAKFSNAIEEILVSSMSNISMIFGYIGAFMLRGLLLSCLILIITLLFTNLHIHNIYMTFIVGFLSSFLMCNLGFINGLLARSFDETSIISSFILSPMIYLGGVFYSVDFLPSPWNKIAYYNPILYMVDLMRYSILGVSDINIAVSLMFLILSCLIIFSILWYMINIGFRLKK